MEIRRVLWGENGVPSSARPAQKAERKTAASDRPSADRLELSRQWVEQMEEQSARLKAALLTGGKEKDEGGILGFMETEEDKLDALSEQLDVQMKCMKIAANIMKGKKVPPEDERYLMEHDPNGYKLAISMRSLSKKDDKECESVLKDEDKNDGEISEGGEAASSEAPSGGEGAASSGGGAE